MTYPEHTPQTCGLKWNIKGKTNGDVKIGGVIAIIQQQKVIFCAKIAPCP